MSRTKHHRNQKRQHCGHDLWSRRGDLHGHASYNSYGKKLTIDRERRIQKEELTKVLTELG